ncbi:MAG: S-layer homology domain-containing protein [Acidobacteria bacterium]|nr:S-layer homology domain-containing protein [Acidobacteriota bacterium]
MLFVSLLVVFCTGGAVAGWAQPAAMVADINTTQEDVVNWFFTYPGFVQVGTNVLFIHDDGIHGLELWRTDGTAAGTALVKDICPGACWAMIHTFAVWNGVLYFGADDGVHGQELWKSDGTAAGTTLVADVNPGLPSGFRNVLVAGGKLYLTADDGVHGVELWTTDGTAAGTVLVKDINPGPAGSLPRLWLDTGGRLLLNADDGVHGQEPWMSDGTAAGTTLLADVNPGAGSSSPPFSSAWEDAAVLPGGRFVFQADDGSHGAELWISDGTPAGTALVQDVNPGPDASAPFNLLPFAGRVLFRACDATHGFELWATDGTAAGTVLVKDIAPGPFGSAPLQLTPFGGQVYFEADDSTSGRELWRTDGTAAGTVLVKDINPGPAGGFTFVFRYPITALDSALYFFADDGVHGAELWKSDGTAAGTTLVKDIYPGNVGGFALGFAGMATLDGRLFFEAIAADGIEPWVSDGTDAGTVEVKNVSAVASGLPVFNGFLNGSIQDLGNGRLVFPGPFGLTAPVPWGTDGTAAGTQPLSPGDDFGWYLPFRFGAQTLLGGNGLWTTDGTPGGTARVVPQTTLGSASGFVAALGAVYFSGGNSLWMTDGTAAGTAMIQNLGPNANATVLGALGSSVFFSASSSTFGQELYRSTGVNSVFFLGDLNPGTGSSYPASFTPLGSVAVFTADGGTATGQELFVTDGTQGGTGLLKDVQPGAGSSHPTSLLRLGGSVLFVADDGATGLELWRTDGTTAGTVQVKDVNPGPGAGIQFIPSSGLALTPMGNAVYFVADDGTSGRELWKSDGTAAGTVRVKDIRPGSASSDVDLLTVAGNRLFFVADDGVHGRELWVSDGTGAGTRMTRDAAPGPGSPAIQGLTALGFHVLFSADDGVHGRELWRSNGGPAGTFQVQDIAPGAAPSTPTGFAASGDGVYFAANDNLAGFELWRAPRAALMTTFSDVPLTHWAWQFIEAVAGAGLTQGCGAGQYCPSQTVSRAETAVFLTRGLHGSGFTPPPATGTRFQDVPASYWAADFIEQLAADGITNGCGASRFCPDSLLDRAEAAIFLLRSRHGASYAPPPATGTRFQDVPPGYWAGDWIEQLAAEGISNGCAANRFCPEDPVSRDQMAVFLARTFNLPLP